MMHGDEMRERARAWVERNPEAWERMKSMARRSVAECRRFSIDQLAVAARYEMATEGLDQGFKVNNTLRAPLARMLMAEVPGAERCMEVRKSKADA